MKRRRALIGRAAIGLLALVAPVGASFADCKIVRLAEFPVTMSGMRALVKAKINGLDADLAVDSGAFFNMMSRASAAEYRLNVVAAPPELVVRGVGGSVDVALTTVREFGIAGASLHNVQFLVGGSESGGVAILGQNVLHLADVEYDFRNGALRLMRPEGCRHALLAYWAAPGQAYSVVDIKPTSAADPQAVGSAEVNGAKISVAFDTGAPTSLLSMRAANKAGVTVQTPGVIAAGSSYGLKGAQYETWIAPFASFKLGTEEIRNTRLRIGEPHVLADMLIGADFFLSHRVYVSNDQNKLYFTYNGGPVFNLDVAPKSSAGSAPPAADAPPAVAAPSMQAAPSAQDGATPGGATPAPGQSTDEPTDAAGFFRRGMASAARRDVTHAIADLSQASTLAPQEPEYFYQRGLLYARNHEPFRAMADFDQALKLKTDDIPALIARAELKSQGRDPAGAKQDLDAADGFAAKESDVRLELAHAYSRAGFEDQAIAQFDRWIEFHRDDGRLADALSTRSWDRALQGTDLDKALSDCSRALRLVPEGDRLVGPILATRGLVQLRLGHYADSIADFDASLKANQKNAFALYGRGLAELRAGQTAAGQADLDAANALSTAPATLFGRHGIVP